MTTTALPDPRTDLPALERARRGVESLVCGMPGDPSEVGFEHPWEIRAFAMAVAARNALEFDWSVFQAALVDSIKSWELDEESSDKGAWSYYQHWVAALETVIAGLGFGWGDELDQRTRTVLAEPPNRNHHEAHTEPIAIDPARTANV